MSDEWVRNRRGVGDVDMLRVSGVLQEHVDVHQLWREACQRTCPSHNTLANVWPVGFLGVFSAGLPTLLVPWQLALVGLPEVDLGRRLLCRPELHLPCAHLVAGACWVSAQAPARRASVIDRLGGLHVGWEGGY